MSVAPGTSDGCRARKSIWLNHPWVTMILAVVGVSLFPLAVEVGFALGENAWLFQAAGSAGKVLATAVYVWFYRDVFGERGFLRWSVRYVFDPSTLWRPEARRRRRSVALVLLMAASQFHDGLFAFATGFVDTAVAVIIHSVWPVVFVLILTGDYRQDGRYRRFRPWDRVLVAAAFGGVALVTVGADPDGASLSMSSRAILGAALVLVATTLGAFMSKGYKWGTDRAVEMAGGKREEMVFGMVAYGAANLVCLPGTVALATIHGSGLSPRGVAVAFLFGLFVAWPASLLFRHANLYTTKLTVVGLAYTQPLFALLWLSLFTTITVGNVPLVAAGAVVVLGANLLASPLVRRNRSSTATAG